MTVELVEMRWAVTVSQHRSLYRAAETLQVRQSTRSRRMHTTRTGARVGKMLAAKLNGDRPKRVLHQEARLDRLLSLVSTGYGVLLMLEGGAGLKQEGVVYREIREGTEPTRLSFMAYW